MNYKKSTVLAIFFYGTFAFGGGSHEPPQTKEEAKPSLNPTLYIGAGASSLSIENDKTSEEFSSPMWTLVGGVNLNEYFGVEARYYRSFGDMEYEHGTTGSPNYDDYPATFVSYGVYAKLQYPIEEFTPYVLIGYGQVEFDGLPYIEGRDPRIENTFQWGAGVSYKITENFSFFVDYMKLYNKKGFDGRAETANISIDAIGVGVSYNF